MPYSATKIGNEFLRLARESDPPQCLTPLQLIKLVYIAHGWTLHFANGEPLLNEPAQAWQYGPVIPSLYQAVKQYRSSPITDPLDDTDPQELGEQARDVVSAVYLAYSGLSGTQLSSMTHQPNTPWSIAWNTAGKNALITNESIREHYDNIAGSR